MQLKDARHVDGPGLRAVFGCFPSGVIAVCAMRDGRLDGMAASAFTAVSLDPPLVSVCAQETSATWPRLRETEAGPEHAVVRPGDGVPVTVPEGW